MKKITSPSLKRKKVYHTQECRHFTRAKFSRDVSENEIEWHDLTECEACQGIEAKGGGCNHEWYHINKQLRNGELG